MRNSADPVEDRITQSEVVETKKIRYDGLGLVNRTEIENLILIQVSFGLQSI